MDNKYKQCGSYRLGVTLGRGLHSKVKQAFHLNGTTYAIKIFKKKQSLIENLKSLATEVRALQNLSHPNIIKIIEFSNSMEYKKTNGQTEARVCLIQELAEKGELFKFVNLSGGFNEDITRFYFKQLIHAIQYMHLHGYTHRDLKLENIVLNKDFCIKITDFGSSSLLNKYQDCQLRTISGTQMYMAPELINLKKYKGEEIDLFALGVILFTLITGFYPFNKASINDTTYKRLIQNDIKGFWNKQTNKLKNETLFSSNLKDLLTKMLSPEPADRLSIEEILSHPWTQESVPNDDEIYQYMNEKSNQMKQVRQNIVKKENSKKAGKVMIKQDQLVGGIGKFRDMQKQCLDYTRIEQQFSLKSEKRGIEEFEDQMLNESGFQCLINKDLLFKYLILEYEEYCSEILKISEKKYKMDVRYIDNDNIGNVLIYKIVLRQKDDIVWVDFIKKSGNAIDFWSKANKIQQLLLTIQ